MVGGITRVFGKLNIVDFIPVFFRMVPLVMTPLAETLHQVSINPAITMIINLPLAILAVVRNQGNTAAGDVTEIPEEARDAAQFFFFLEIF